MDCQFCGAAMTLRGHTDWGALVFVCAMCGFQYAEDMEHEDDHAWIWGEDDDDDGFFTALDDLSQ